MFSLKKDNSPQPKTLKKKLIYQYLYMLLTIVILVISLPLLFNFMMGDNTGIDGIGQAFVVRAILNILKYIVIIIVFIVNPIRILISYKNHSQEILSKAKKVKYIILTILPMLLSLLILLEGPISDYVYHIKYNTGKNAYTVNSDEYKTPKDFERELDKRGFVYNSKPVLSRLNSKYTDIDEEFSKYYYEEASVMPLFTQSDSFYDSTDYNDIITFDSDTKAPAYIYNTILYLYDQNEDLQYAPVSRYEDHNYIVGSSYPFYQDYYIECKILYVDDDIYAIIGVGQNHNTNQYFADKREDYRSSCDYPYYMILSEKDNITTFFEGKYYPDGAIDNNGERFEMRPNTNESSWLELYPVRKVDKLDIITLNKVAKELQEGILKDSIEYHFDTIKSNN